MRDDGRPDLMIVAEIPGGPEAAAYAMQAVDDGVAALPPNLRPLDGESFAIVVRHREKCPSRVARDVELCDCETLMMEARIISEEEADAMERAGKFDVMIDENVDPKSLH